MAKSILGALRAAIIAFAVLAPTLLPGAASAQRGQIVTARERAQAQLQHPQIIAEFGGEVTGPLSVYVKGVGEKMAVAAGLPNTCTFTVINSNVANAFAVPGCSIYVTRGLLAIMNSEDELASVLGHEVGHITGRHSAGRQNRSVLTQLGAIAVGVATGSGELAQIAGQAGQLLTLRYSRGQEFDSDSRGMAYMKVAGYNLVAAADMLNALSLSDALAARESGRATESAIPVWTRSHPLTADRVARAATIAQQQGATREAGERVQPYFAALNNMLWGDDPEQGFVNGRTFAHPKLKIAFDAPQGFTLNNTSRAVIIGGPNGARAQFGSAQIPAGGLDEYAAALLRSVLGQAPARVGQLQRTTTNGLETVILPAQAQAQSGQVAEVTSVVYRVAGVGYHFVTIAPAGGSQVMGPMVRSMRALSDAEAAALRARRIEVVTVRPGDTVQSLAARMAFTDLQVDRFVTLNGLEPARPLSPGTQVKLIRWMQ